MRARTRYGLTVLAVIAGFWTAAPAATAAPARTTVTVAAVTTTAPAAAAATASGPALTRIPRPARPASLPRAGSGVAPATATPQDSFSEVSCLNPRDCIGVGGNNVGDGGFGSPLAGVWNGSRWSTGSPALPHGSPGGELYSVDCHPGGCIAVGYYYVNSTTWHPLAMRWNGATWSLLTQPAVPAGSSSSLVSVVSCTTALSCDASGYYGIGAATGGLLETWSGSGWHIVRLPSPKTSYGALGSVSCATASSCVAVGTYKALTGNNYYALAYVLSGGIWRNVAAANPNTALGYQDVLQSVSCPSATLCVAVGTVGKPTSSTFFMTGFAEAWNGSSWKLQTVTWPAGSHSVLYAVSCPAITYCVAAGGTGAYTTYNDGTLAAQAWNGTTWSQTPMPKPSGGVGSVLFGVRCLPATRSCTAAGDVGPLNSAGHALSGFWNGSTWSLVTTA